MEDKSCKTPRWRMLKSLLNNLYPQEFKKMMGQSNEIVIVDVRSPKEFKHDGLPSAININFLAHDFWDKIDQLDRKKTYLVYCRTGRRSIRACTLMSNGGFDKKKIYNMDGGMVSWQETFKE